MITSESSHNVRARMCSEIISLNFPNFPRDGARLAQIMQCQCKDKVSGVWCWIRYRRCRRMRVQDR